MRKPLFATLLLALIPPLAAQSAGAGAFSGALFTEKLKVLESSDPELYADLSANCPRYIEYVGGRSYSTGWKDFGENLIESGKILAMTTLSAIAYGIAMDCVTANICIEYFSTGFHYDNLGSMAPALNDFLFRARNPFLYAMTWGVIATWWVGLPLGVPLSLSSRSNVRAPKADWRGALPKVGVALGSTFIVAMLSGLETYLARADVDDLTRRYNADLSIHNAAYLWGTLFGLGVSAWTEIERRGRAQAIEKERRYFLDRVLDARLKELGEEAALAEKELLRSVVY
jgi:hypothetical protein